MTTNLKLLKKNEVRHIHKNKKSQEIIQNTLIYSLLIFSGVFMILPFLWMVIMSFDLSASIRVPFPPTLWPAEPTLISYKGAIQAMNLARVYLNSLLVTSGVIIISVSTAMAAAYSLSKIKFKGWKIILAVILSTLMVPLEVRIIPLFRIFHTFNLINTYWCFWLTAPSNGYLIFLAKTNIDSLPDSLREAAIIDGANEWWVFRRVVVPLCTNVIATMVILQFLQTWNDLLWPLICLVTPSKFTMQVQLSMLKTAMSVSGGGSAEPFPSMTMAGNVLSIIPILIVFLFLQKFIVNNIALSGIKE